MPAGRSLRATCGAHRSRTASRVRIPWRDQSSPAARAAAASDIALPDPLACYAENVRDRSFRITDADFDALKHAGHTEDEIFEITIAAAWGGAWSKFEAGRRLLRRNG